MTASPTPTRSILAPQGIALGDIIQVPDGASHTVRAVMRLPVPHNAVSGFIILGEFEAALSIPALQTVPAGVMSPKAPAAIKGQQVQTIVEGVTRYWPPHIPAIPGAMSDIPYKVLAVRGQEHPVLVCFRGPDVIVFTRDRSVWMADLLYSAMGLSDALDGPALPRRSGEVVIDATQPYRGPARHIPAPAHVPSAEPAHVAAHR